MQQIPIKAIPNQQFTLSLDGALWDITLRASGMIMLATISRENVKLLDSVRVVAGNQLLPYRYQEHGNFAFITQNGEYPFYTKFNASQDLVYFSPDELAALRAKPAPPVDASFFNGAGALPLRFSPQGYG